MLILLDDRIKIDINLEINKKLGVDGLILILNWQIEREGI